eukprot:CAMPEP_0117443642 /NCGR_PEP_ID=MMETSP0759-20121206/4804_1 /TAXON_ID=63605 /ORGANISM="Percolomonas cosmopolitus, Strain WS" /LENGTH=658 /DNA_ID=CAMNT_0005235631 /DNA_START=39 /DNA_END=2015 /DNA_ORIENTATION=-
MMPQSSHPSLTSSKPIILPNASILTRAPSCSNLSLSLHHFHLSEQSLQNNHSSISSHAFHELFHNVSEAIACARHCEFLPQYLLFRALMLREYIQMHCKDILKSHGIDIQQERENSSCGERIPGETRDLDYARIMEMRPLREYWVRIALDVQVALRDFGLVKDVGDRGSGVRAMTTPAGDVVDRRQLERMMIRLGAEADMRLGSLEKAKDKLVLLVQGTSDDSEQILDMESAMLLHEVVERLTLKTNDEKRQLEQRVRELEEKEKGIGSKVQNIEDRSPANLHNDGVPVRVLCSTHKPTNISPRDEEQESASVLQDASSPQTLQEHISKFCLVRSNPMSSQSFGAPPRQQHASTTVSNVVYFHGGYSNDSEELGDFFSTNLTTGDWSMLDSGNKSNPEQQPLPRYAHSLTQCTVNRSLSFIIYGGRTENGASDELWSYDEENKWQLRSRHVPLFGHLCVPLSSDRVAFLFGKSGKDSFSEMIHMYSAKENEWQEIQPVDTKDEPFPPARAFSAGAIWNQNKFVIFGGMDVFSGRALNDVWVCDNVSEAMLGKAWRQLRPKGDMPPGVHNHDVVVHDNCLYVLGRYEDPFMYVLNLDTEKWEKVALRFHEKHQLMLREGYSCALDSGSNNLCIFFGQDEDNGYPREHLSIALPILSDRK